MSSKCGRVLAVAVHDLRTPLAIVAGYLGLLSRQHLGPLSPRQHDLLRSMEKATESLTKLVSEMSDFSNLENRTLLLKRRTLKLTALLRDVSEGVARTGAGRIEVHGPLPPTTIAGDPQRLRSALIAILTPLLREAKDNARFLVRQRAHSSGSRAFAFIAAGEEMTVDRLLKASARRLIDFNVAGGARNLAAVVGCHVIEAHGGKTWMLRGPHEGSGVMIRLPLARS